MKTPKERDTLDLLELVCQLHYRSIAYPSKAMHDACIEARKELEARIKGKDIPSPVKSTSRPSLAIWMEKNGWQVGGRFMDSILYCNEHHNQMGEGKLLEMYDKENK